jgi:hypothetical protein
MQGQEWVGLLRRIPAAQHDNIIFMTTNSTQIVMQRIIRLESDFLVGLGRVAGSTEQGKVLVLPYDQLTYLSFSKKLTDAEIETILGQAAFTPPLRENAASSNGIPTTPDEKQTKEPEPPTQAGSVEVSAEKTSPATVADPASTKPNGKAPMPSKSILLARLRQRLVDDAGKQLKP